MQSPPDRVPEPTPFRIDWIFPATWPAAEGRAWSDKEVEQLKRLYFEAAARRWSYVLKGWPPGPDGKPLKLPSGQPFTAIEIQVVFDDFLDGAGGVAARVPQSGVRCLQTSAGQPLNFTYRAVLEIDLRDAGAMRTRPSYFLDTVVHEIGHVLGIGMRWSDKVPAPPLVKTVNGQHVYVGSAGRAAYESLTGKSGVGIPLDRETQNPVSFHWSETLLRLEIMSPELDDSTVDQIQKKGRVAISSISVGALKDLGYAVDEAAAEWLRLEPSPVTSS